jgi:hypothetical protein
MFGHALCFVHKVLAHTFFTQLIYGSAAKQPRHTVLLPANELTFSNSR